MTAYLITWQAPDGDHAERRQTWSEAIGLEAAHWADHPHLDIVEPETAECVHCRRPITQALTPDRWNDRFGDDRCAAATARWHEAPRGGWQR